MKKKSNNILHIFVKKITQKWEKIVQKKEILTLWLRSGWQESRFSYALNMLAMQNLLSRIARDIYILNPVTDFEQLYWKIIEKIIEIYAPTGAIIGWEKSLELHMMNFLSPQKLVLYTRDVSQRIRLLDGREVHFRTLHTGEKTEKKPFFPFLKKYCTILKGTKNILLPSLEVSLLEALSLRENNIGINDAIILQFLQRNSKKLQLDIFHEMVKYRYIRSINRLRQIAKTENYPEIYEATLRVIKSEGGGIFLHI